ncbi:hypothetical protein [uncultured Bacteroides sp.]|uniref:RipA family octameric membrane protein n=1 Tax=uncultured Bacteroides sp. TaxID=162156 RepID=UPI002AAA8961|nr:hypothetical protein [uncultured Bacteroides sp.]
MCKNENYVKVLDRLYKCRDLEISNLWQRSIYLSVFITLCFTGYGVLIFNIIQKCNVEYYIELSYLHLVSVFLSFVGCVFSALWTYMSKGSKAWYEVYETAISTFENNYKNKLDIPEENIMGTMGIPIKKINNCILSTAAGTYSPSKINILIGQVCFIGWVAIFLAHCIFSCFCVYRVDSNRLSDPLIFKYVILCTLAVLLLLLFFLLKNIQTKYARSRHLYDTIYDDTGFPYCERKDWDGTILKNGREDNTTIKY